MPTFRVAPDGALLDRVAEFMYERPKRIQDLFSVDEEGYFDSVARLVQTIAVGGQIVGSRRKGATECTDRLKSVLDECGRLDFVDFFNEEERPNRLRAANEWLAENWDQICCELDARESETSLAFMGHMRREFYYFWLKFDPQWTHQWYSPAAEALPLPPGTRQRILSEISRLGSQHNLDVTPEAFGNWTDQNVTTHYRIFAEYWLHLGESTGEEYMPALTRSSLRFLSNDSTQGVTPLIIPFVALAAAKCVRHRKSLIPEVVDWTQGRGREIVDGLQELQSIARSARDPELEKKILADVTQILRSEYSREFLVTLNLIRMIASAIGGKVDSEAAQNVVKLTQSKTYRWLWSIREPDIQVLWRTKVRELMQAGE